MNSPDIATIQALRSDLALQIARHVSRSEQSQVTAAKRLGIPQPTLSKIMNGRVTELSLELLIRIAVRAGLPIVLQTGKVPAEAGAFVSGRKRTERTGSPSKLADEAREAMTESTRRLTPAQRLEAYLKHSELVTALHNAGQAHHAGKSARLSKRSR
jgi:predicted XRE-type DNA-binding protein